MNDVLQVIRSHRSIRKFKPVPLTTEQIDAIVEAAQMAPSSMHMQPFSIIGVTEALPELDEWLELPEFVIPLCGLAVGVPDESPEQKPRLPRSAVFFENRYNPNLKAAIDEFDRQIETYYGSRLFNRRKGNWSGKLTAILGQKLPVDMYTKYVRHKGFYLVE